jgi:hypothetical protein
MHNASSSERCLYAGAQLTLLAQGSSPDGQQTASSRGAQCRVAHVVGGLTWPHGIRSLSTAVWANSRRCHSGNAAGVIRNPSRNAFRRHDTELLQPRVPQSEPPSVFPLSGGLSREAANTLWVELTNGPALAAASQIAIRRPTPTTQSFPLKGGRQMGVQYAHRDSFFWYFPCRINPRFFHADPRRALI